jgi:hypothetical protein
VVKRDGRCGGKIAVGEQSARAGVGVGGEPRVVTVIVRPAEVTVAPRSGWYSILVAQPAGPRLLFA